MHEKAIKIPNHSKISKNPQKMSQDLRDNSEHQKRISEFIERDFTISNQEAYAFERMLRREYMNHHKDEKLTSGISEIVSDLSDIISQARRRLRGVDEKEYLIVDLEIIEKKAVQIIETIRQYL